jgi:hypothetical protein
LRKTAFIAQTRTFHETLQRIEKGLLAQANALEDTGLIPAYTPKTVPGEKDEITNGGLGNLDVGFLNGRARDVAIGKEGKLVAEARRVAERILNGKEGEEGDEEEADGDEMEESE